MSTTRIFQNCGPLCAEMLGGDCPGENCVYKPTLTLVSDEEWLNDWAPVDWRQVEQAAEERGLRLGHRNARIQYRQGIKLGFGLGVLAVFALLLALAIVLWFA